MERQPTPVSGMQLLFLCIAGVVSTVHCGLGWEATGSRREALRFLYMKY